MNLLLYILIGLSLSAGPSQIGYQGRLFSADGTPVNSDTASFVLQVFDPAAECLLYEESHEIQMDQSSGYFSLQIGSGTQNITTAPAFNLATALSNQGTQNDPLMGCASFTPAADDKRLLRVTINGTPLQPDQTIGSIPYAIHATNIGGKPLSQIESEYQSHANENWAGFPLPTTPLNAGDSFRWDGTKWETFQPGSAQALTDVIGGSGLTAGGTTTKTLDIGAGDGIVANADDIAVNAGDGLQFDTGVLTANIGSGLQFNAGAIELNQSAIDYSNLTNTPATATPGTSGLMSDTDKTKLDGIESSATADQTGGEILTLMLGEDGSSSGLDADLLDGQEGTYYLDYGNLTNTPTIPDGHSLDAADGSPTDVLSVDNNGDIGIGGAASAGIDLTVHGHVDIQNSGTLRFGGITLIDGGFRATNSQSVTSPALSMYNDQNNGIFFPDTDVTAIVTNGSERIRVDASGRVGIGTVNPTYNLEVVGDIAYSGVLTDTSDERLKENIKNLDARDMMQRLLQVQGVSFSMKDDPSERKEFGVIAQQVEKHLPELVVTANDQLKTKSVNYLGMIAPMIEVLRLQQRQIEALKAEVRELKRDR